MDYFTLYLIVSNVVFLGFIFGLFIWFIRRRSLESMLLDYVRDVNYRIRTDKSKRGHTYPTHKKDLTVKERNHIASFISDFGLVASFDGDWLFIYKP